MWLEPRGVSRWLPQKAPQREALLVKFHSTTQRVNSSGPAGLHQCCHSHLSYFTVGERSLCHCRSQSRPPPQIIDTSEAEDVNSPQLDLSRLVSACGERAAAIRSSRLQADLSRASDSLELQQLINSLSNKIFNYCEFKKIKILWSQLHKCKYFLFFFPHMTENCISSRWGQNNGFYKPDLWETLDILGIDCFHHLPFL